MTSVLCNADHHFLKGKLEQLAYGDLGGSQITITTHFPIMDISLHLHIGN